MSDPGRSAILEHLADPAAHPRSRDPARPDPDGLARDLESIRERAAAKDLSTVERRQLRDRLAAMAERVDWVENEPPRTWLKAELRHVQAMMTEPS